MKKLIKSMVVTAGMLIPLVMNAQSPLDKVFEKYSGREGYNAVNISKDMFQMFTNMAGNKDTSNAGMKKMIGQLTGLKMITTNVDSVKPAVALAFYNEAAAVFAPSLYKELMNVNDDGTNVRFLARQDNTGVVQELVMLEKGKREVVVTTITGNIDLATIGNLSNAMNIKGMDKLKNYKDSHKK